MIYIAVCIVFAALLISAVLRSCFRERDNRIAILEQKIDVLENKLKIFTDGY